MPDFEHSPGVAPGRLPQAAYAENFADLHPPLGNHAAQVAADRCYFCHDAPCVTACPTEIDIPLFIRQISTGMPEAAARTIFDQNILGGMCARACPTETLCEEACVRTAAECAPVEIGRLQRHATDTLISAGFHPYERAPESGRRVAVVGAGPAGLACAHRLSMKGHSVVVFEARRKPGGLNEYGIATYKTVGGFASREVDWLLSIGGIEIRPGRLGDDLDLAGLRRDYDAVFLAVGLAGLNALALDGESAENVDDAVAFISDLRQAADPGSIPVGRDIIVIGGGMTAIDAAVQSRLLGARTVSIVYRRGRDRMNASGFEQDLALRRGVRIITNARAVRVNAGGGRIREVEFVRTREHGRDLVDTGETFRLPADQLFRAIGQRFDLQAGGLEIAGGRIRAGESGRTSLEGVWAGGDCTGGGEDLTVTAVAEGRDAAEDIHQFLVGD